MIKNSGRRLDSKRMHSKVSLPNVIDGVTGSVSIVNLICGDHIIMIYLIVSRMTLYYLYNNLCYEPDIEVSHDDITSGIEGLANNKSCGLDGVSAEHVKHSSNRIVPMLAVFYWFIYSWYAVTVDEICGTFSYR